MTRPSDAQLTILSTAAQRPDGNLLPLPGSLRGGAAGKVVGALLARGLAHEKVIDSTRRADSGLNTVWRNIEDGRGVLLLVTAAGLDALGIEAGGACGGVAGAKAGSAAMAAQEAAGEAGPEPAGEPEAASTGHAAAPTRKVREGTKQAALIAMLRRKEGATIAEIVTATGWQPHTVRGAFAGVLKKKLGLTVTSEKVEGGERIYRLEQEA